MSSFNENHNVMNGYHLAGRGDNDISPYSLSGFYSKTLHGAFNENQNVLNGYHLAGRGDNDISKFSLNGYHLAGRGDNDISKFSLNSSFNENQNVMNGYHLAGRGDNDISPYSLSGNKFSLGLKGVMNGDAAAETGYSMTTVIAVGVGALVLGAVGGMFLFKKK